MRTLKPQQIASLFDHLVGTSKQRGRQLQPELPCSFLVHDQLKFGWSLNRQFGRIGTAQDSINIGCCACDNLFDLHPVGHEAASLAEDAKRVDRGKPALRNQRSNLIAPDGRDSIRQKNEPTIRLSLNERIRRSMSEAIAARCFNRDNSYSVCDFINRLAKCRGIVARFRVVHDADMLDVWCHFLQAAKPTCRPETVQMA